MRIRMSGGVGGPGGAIPPARPDLQRARGHGHGAAGGAQDHELVLQAVIQRGQHLHVLRLFIQGHGHAPDGVQQQGILALGMQTLLVPVEQLLDAGAELATGADVRGAVLVIQAQVLAAKEVRVEVRGAGHVAVGAALTTAQELGDHLLKQGLPALHGASHHQHLPGLPPVGVHGADGALEPAVEVHALVMLRTCEEALDQGVEHRPRSRHERKRRHRARASSQAPGFRPT